MASDTMAPNYKQLMELHGQGINAIDPVSFARAVLAKWGAPAPASHEALTTALAACRDAFPVPASGSAAEFEWQGAMTDPLGVPAYVRACAVPPAQEARVPLSDGQIEQGHDAADIAPTDATIGTFTDGVRFAEKHHGITAAQKETP